MTQLTASEIALLADKLSGFDIFDADHNDHKKQMFAYARGACPVTPVTGNGPTFLVTRYEDVRQVLEDWETFSSTQAPIMDTGISLCPLDNDPPIQSVVRQVLNPLFSKRSLAPYEEPMRATARDLIGKFRDRGSLEALSEFSGPYVGEMLIKIVFSEMGPEQLREAQHIAHQVSESPTPEVYGQLLAMCTEYLAQASASGGGDQDGVLARILAAEVEGRPLSHELQVGVLSLLVLGGLDTTRAAIGNILYRMTQTPGLESRLRNPNWVRRDLDELLRLDPPVPLMCRVATRDTELQGVAIKAGQRVQLRYDSANWDESKFVDADRLVFDTPRAGHASFGMGVHRCVGSNLARMQIEIAFDELLGQIKNVRLAPPAEITWVPGQATVLQAVDIEFDVLE